VILLQKREQSYCKIGNEVVAKMGTWFKNIVREPMNNDAEIVRVVFLIMGSFDVLLGFVIKRFQLADIIAGYDFHKYDKKKITDIVGSNFILMGLLIIFITIVYYFVPALNLDLYITSMLIIIFGLVIKIVWDTSKHARI
jgi:hypothetical protein